jgi:transmembrane sensor
LDEVKQQITLPKIIVPKKPLFYRLWALPALAICCLALWLFSSLPILLRADFYTGYGERRDIALNDGSVAHLNSNSALAVHIDGKQRQLTLLQGEAWFEVSPDKSLPFQVHAEHGTVTALGTAFNIRLRNSLAEVCVTQHSVAIDVEQAEGRMLHTVVKEGQQLVYDQHTGLGNIKAIDSQTVTAWQRGKLVFEDKPLGEVMAELNQYHRGYLVISDNSIAQRRVNGVFSADQPLVVLGALESSLQLHLTRINDYLILLHR